MSHATYRLSQPPWLSSAVKVPQVFVAFSLGTFLSNVSLFVDPDACVSWFSISVCLQTKNEQATGGNTSRHALPFCPDAAVNMVEDKKSDDYTVHMDKIDQGNKEFGAAPATQPRVVSPSTISNNPAFPVLAYCGSSILMTVMNKYVLSGLDFNLNFLLLCVQVG